MHILNLPSWFVNFSPDELDINFIINYYHYYHIILTYFPIDALQKLFGKRDRRGMAAGDNDIFGPTSDNSHLADLALLLSEALPDTPNL